MYAQVSSIKYAAVPWSDISMEEIRPMAFVALSLHPSPAVLAALHRIPPEWGLTGNKRIYVGSSDFTRKPRRPTC